MIGDLAREFRFTLRSLLRAPLASGFIVATLALCIGAVAAVYSIADVVLVHALPFDRPERLVWVSSVRRERADAPFTLPEFLDYRSASRSLRLAAFTTWSAIVDRPSGAQWVQGLRMSGDALEVLGATPAAGRPLVGSDDAPGAPRVAMLGEAYWRRAYAGDPGAVGHSIRLNGVPTTIVGVLPRYFPLPVRDVDIVVPLDPASDPRRSARSSVSFLRIVGRLAPGTDRERAQGDLQRTATLLRREFPTDYANRIGVHVTPLHVYLATTLRPTLLVLLACVALLVAIALANASSLMLARSVRRQGEIAIRMALGASRPRIAARSLAEGLVLVTTAGCLGTSLAGAAIGYASTHLRGVAPRIEEAHVGGGVLLVVAAICALAVLLLSVIPILAVRSTTMERMLRSAGRGGDATAAQARLRAAFVVAEVALALVLVSATGALVQNLSRLERVDLGYRPDSVFVVRLSLPPRRYPTPGDLSRFAATLTAALAREPQVRAAGGSSIAPLSGVLASVPVAPAQAPPADRRDWPSAGYRAVSSGYLEAIGVRPRKGRLIEDRDDERVPAVAVVNRALEERCFARTGAIDRELLIDDNDTGPRAVRIVGVVDDLRDVELDRPARPEVFIAMRQTHPDAIALVTATQFWAARLRGDPAGFGPRFLRVLHAVDPAVGTATATDLRSYVNAALAPRRFSVGLLVTFALVSILLTTLGVYGIAAHAVEQRRREIAIRIALGATPARVVRLIAGRGLRLAVAGACAGVLVVLLANGILSRLLFGVSPASIAILAGVTALLLVTATVASMVPGLRAARIDPARALSAE